MNNIEKMVDKYLRRKLGIPLGYLHAYDFAVSILRKDDLVTDAMDNAQLLIDFLSYDLENTTCPKDRLRADSFEPEGGCEEGPCGKVRRRDCWYEYLCKKAEGLK
jgi:hypothetical protein